MLEVKVTIAAPELAAAINNLASAMSGAKPIQTGTITPAPAPVPNPIPAPTAPVAPPAPAAPAAQMNYPAPSVPLAAPPQYTVDQIMAAGATLMDAGKVNELMALLHSFGVQAVMDLKPEQLGAFATAMRDLGAKI